MSNWGESEYVDPCLACLQEKGYIVANVKVSPGKYKTIKIEGTQVHNCEPEESDGTKVLLATGNAHGAEIIKNTFGKDSPTTREVVRAIRKTTRGSNI